MNSNMNAATAQDTSDAGPAIRAAVGPATNHMAPMTDPTENAVRPNGPTRLLNLRLAPMSIGMVGAGGAALPLDVPVGMPGDVTVDMASPLFDQWSAGY